MQASDTLSFSNAADPQEKGFFKKVFRGLGKVIKPIGSIIKPLVPFVPILGPASTVLGIVQQIKDNNRSG